MRKPYFSSLIALVFSILLLTACGGGGGGGGGAPAPEPESEPEPIAPVDRSTPSVSLSSNQGQALLGPIVNADVFVYDVELIDGSPICSQTTSDLGSPEGPGVIDLSGCDIDSEKLYFMVVNGGEDIDVDDDGELDDTPTPKEGSLRGIYKGEDLLSGGWRVNILTELAYNGVVDSLLVGADTEEILSRLELLALSLIEEDLNGDGAVNYTDLTAFVPIEHADRLLKQDSDFLDSILQAILDDDRNELTVLARQYLLSSLAEFRLNQDSGYYVNREIFVDDNYLYSVGVIDDLSRGDDVVYAAVRIFDISDLNAVQLVGSLDLEGVNSTLSDFFRISTLKKHEDKLIFGVSGAGVVFVDVAAPHSPSIITTYSTPKGISTLDIKDNVLYLGINDLAELSEDDDIRIIPLDISNLDQINEFSSVEVFSRSIEFYQDHMHSFGSEWNVYDVSDPENIVIVNTMAVPEIYGDSVAVHMGYAYVPIVTNRNFAVNVYDIRDPLNISLANVLNTAGQGDLHIGGNRLYLQNEDVLVTYQIVSPGYPIRIDARDSGGWKVSSNTDHVYVVDHLNVLVYDSRSLDDSIQNYDSLDTVYPSRFIEIDDTHAYIAGNASLTVVDILNPIERMQVISGLSFPHFVEDITLEGDLLFSANGSYGLAIMDVSTPSDPSLLYSDVDASDVPPVDFTSRHSVAVKEDYAYAALPYVHAIAIYDVSDPLLTELIGQFDHELPDRLSIFGDNLVTYGLSGQAALYDISDSLNPELLYLFSTNFSDVHIIDSIMYTTSGIAGIEIYDISTPSEPILYGKARGLGIGNEIQVVGEIAYIANDFGFVDIYDVSDMTSPIFIAQIRMSGSVKDLALNDQYLFAVNLFGVSARRISSIVTNLY